MCWTPASCQVSRSQGSNLPHDDVTSPPLCKPVCSSVKWGSPFFLLTPFSPRAEQVPIHCGLLPPPPSRCPHKSPRGPGSLPTWVSFSSQHAFSPWLKSCSVGDRVPGGRV